MYDLFPDDPFDCMFVWIGYDDRTTPSSFVNIVICCTELHKSDQDDFSDARMYFGACLLPEGSAIDVGQTTIDDEAYARAVEALGFDIKDPELKLEFEQLFGGKVVCYFSSFAQFIHDCGDAVGLTADHVVHRRRPVQEDCSMAEQLIQEEIGAAKLMAGTALQYLLK
jgi:hypothetical protein